MSAVGVIGLGVMGGSFARCLSEAGFDVVGFDVRGDAAEVAKDVGVVLKGSAAEVAGSAQTVLISLPGPKQVLEVLLGDGTGVLGAMAPESVCVDTSTVGPTVAHQLSRAFEASGRLYVDAPVSGRPPNMTVLASGSQDGFAVARPVLEAIGAHVQWLGGAGSASLVKVLNQYVTYVAFAVTTEAMVLAEERGVPATSVAEAFSVSSAENRMIGAGVEAATDDVSSRWGSVEMIAKDMHLVQETIEAVTGRGLPIADACSGYFAGARDAGRGTAPFPAAGSIIRSSVLGR